VVGDVSLYEKNVFLDWMRTVLDSLLDSLSRIGGAPVGTVGPLRCQLLTVGLLPGFLWLAGSQLYNRSTSQKEVKNQNAPSLFVSALKLLGRLLSPRYSTRSFWEAPPTIFCTHGPVPKGKKSPRHPIPRRRPKCD